MQKNKKFRDQIELFLKLLDQIWSLNFLNQSLMGLRRAMSSVTLSLETHVGLQVSNGRPRHWYVQHMHIFLVSEDIFVNFCICNVIFIRSQNIWDNNAFEEYVWVKKKIPFNVHWSYLCSLIYSPITTRGEYSTSSVSTPKPMYKKYLILCFEKLKSKLNESLSKLISSVQFSF